MFFGIAAPLSLRSESAQKPKLNMHAPGMRVAAPQCSRSFRNRSAGALACETARSRGWLGSNLKRSNLNTIGKLNHRPKWGFQNNEDATILVGMQIQGKVVIVTGGSNGIGRALCHKFAAEGARAVVVADIDREAGVKVAAEIKDTPGGFAHCNVSREKDVHNLVDSITDACGQVDIFCSNAGIGTGRDENAPDSDWQRSWEVNVMAHVYAARAVLPQMLKRKEGYLLQTVSAAGLLTQVGSASYSVTKHAALSFAEWLSIAHGDEGIRVSALCPMGVRTNMLAQAEADGGAGVLNMDTAIEPSQVAQEVVRAMKDEKFLILPHPEVAKFFLNKAGDYDRWLRGMRKLKASTQSAPSIQPD
jgi:NAD(P)-dependent dehydrogenase (short-subunit alcohol dehydrogenase family)